MPLRLNYPRPFSAIARVASDLATIACALVLLAASVSAQAPATGTIEGRVLNPATGDYLENARITIEGTSLETFTDSTGQYRLTNVPAGDARVKAFYTGLLPQTLVVNVTSAQTTQHDIGLTATSTTAGSRPFTANDGTVKLSEFVVSTSKEMDGAAIAINEQRFAANILNVVATDEFGDVAEGNVGQFLKFIPGMSVDYNAGDARTLSMNGAPSNNVPVTVGGFNLASSHTSGAAGTERTVELELISINNISRIEVSYSPTPESPGMALAGSVNMVPRGAFERAKASFSYSVFAMMRDNTRILHRTPGLREDKSHKIQPGAEFSYTVPVNKKFGFTLSGNHSKQFAPLFFSQNLWRGSAAATNNFVRGGNPPTQFVDTTADKPYLSDYVVRDGMKFTQRSSIGTTIDFKLSRNDRLTFSFLYAYLDAPFHNRTMTFFVNGVAAGQFSDKHTYGVPGLGEVRMVSQSAQKQGTNYMPTLVWRHDGPDWKWDTGYGHSYASTRYRDIDKGHFNQTTASRTAVTINFDDINYERPGRITVRDTASGALVDPFNIDSYNFTSGTSAPSDFIDVQRSAYVNLRRDLDVRGMPLNLKGGLDLREAMRDSVTGGTTTYNHVGADRVGASTPTSTASRDDGARAIFDFNTFGRGTPFGFPPAQWPSNEQAWALYQANPERFNINLNNTLINEVNSSKRAEELISSAYIRGDLALMERRLKIVGGVRAEQTNIQGEGPLVLDVTRDAAGNRVLPDGTIIRPGTPALEVTRLTRVSRGRHTENEYLRFFPSVNVSYNLRENLIARASYFHSVGRPSFNQYAGGIILPDTELAPANNNRIEITNPEIKAWSARSVKLRLEYYFERVGQVSIGGFVRDVEDFFGNRVFNATPEFLEFNGLDPVVYDPYDVVTQFNLTSKVRLTGLEFDYKQALTFLPHWARGVQAFVNGSALRATGDGSENFAGYTPRTYNWGVSLTRPKYTVRANWNYRSRQRRGIVAAGRSIDPATYNWGGERLYVDVSLEYRPWRRFGFFANLRNITDSASEMEVAGPRTPEYARMRSYEENGALWTMGIKGSF